MLSRSIVLAGLVSMLAASVAPAQVVPEAVDPGLVPRRLEPPPEPRDPPPMVPEPAPRELPPEALAIRFTLQAIRLEGATVYDEADLAPLWEPLLGEEIALAAIFELAERITARYRGDGYILSRAIVPPQSITDGVVRIAVVEGWVSRVLIEGDPGPERLVREIADRIAAARPLRLEVLERSLLLIGDLPGLDVESVLRPSPDEPGAAELVLLARHRALSGELGLSNRGTRFAGRPELSGELRLASALGRHDRTRLRGVINPAATEELRVLAAEHEQPIGSDGTRLALFGALVRTRPGARLEPFDVRGRSTSASLTLSHPLVLTRRQRLDLYGELGLLESRTDVLGVTAVEDRIRAARVGGSWDLADRWGGINLAALELSQGLDVLGAGSELPSRASGRSDFTKLAAEAARVQRLGGGWSLLVTGKGQYALSPLLVSETFDFGGESYGRGYDPSEVTGDHGVALRIELRWGRLIGRPWLQGVQPFLSYDLGVVWNIDPGEGLQARASAASTAAGLRFDLTPQITGSLEVALPLTRPPTVDRTDGKKRPRPFFRLAATF